MIENNIYHTRLAAVREKLDEWDLEALLITSDTNRRWLSGFTGSAGMLLVTKNQALLASDYRYYTQAARQSPTFTLFKYKRQPEDNVKLMEAGGVKKVGLEAQYMSLAQVAELHKVPGITWVELSSTLEPLREVKNEAEITSIAAAAKITDQVMMQVPSFAKLGMTEQMLAWELEKSLRDAGADSLAFPVIVAFGENSALPHHQPGKRPLQANEIILVDMGAQLNGYKSDLTRTFWYGDKPTDQFWSVYNTVDAAVTAVITHAKPGMDTQQVDALARDLISAAGYGENFGHGLGHGVGLDIHESPWLSHQRPKQELHTGMTTTVEPGIYIVNWGGVRLEELTIMTDTGLQTLSHSLRNPIIE